MTFYSPIILFIYKRPEHLKKTLESLARCRGYEHHRIFVFGDGSRSQSEDAAVEETRKVAKDFLGDRAQYFFSPQNKGLAQSVIHGVSKVLGEFESAIIIEDDLIFHLEFLTFINTALQKYAKEEKVSMVSGYMYNVPELRKESKQIFLPLISTWGWGTWARAWTNFDKDATGYERLMSDRQLRKKFNCNGSYPFSRMLELQMKGKIDSWGIRWYWNIFNKNLISCFPPNTLVINNGFDTTATHGRGLLTNFNYTTFPNDNNYKVNVSETVPVSVDPTLYKILCIALYDLNGGHIGKVRDVFKEVIWDKFKKKKSH